MRVLDSSNPKVKAAALELLSQVAPSAVGYLSTPAHVRSCVAKVLPGAADKNADVKRAAVAALHAIHSAGGPVFVQQVALLPPQSQAALSAQAIKQVGALVRATNGCLMYCFWCAAKRLLDGWLISWCADGLSAPVASWVSVATLAAAGKA